jgi:high-affinity Fe2+/Pb2+ permease
VARLTRLKAFAVFLGTWLFFYILVFYLEQTSVISIGVWGLYSLILSVTGLILGDIIREHFKKKAVPKAVSI